MDRKFILEGNTYWIVCEGEIKKGELIKAVTYDDYDLWCRVQDSGGRVHEVDEGCIFKTEKEAIQKLSNKSSVSCGESKKIVAEEIKQAIIEEIEVEKKYWIKNGHGTFIHADGMEKAINVVEKYIEDNL